MDNNVLKKIFDTVEYSEDERNRVLVSLNECLLDGMLDAFMQYLPQDKKKEFIEKTKNTDLTTDSLSEWIDKTIQEKDREILKEKIAKNTLTTLRFFCQKIYENTSDDKRKELDVLFQTKQL